ncbi:hypothetical protein [Carp edema virus]|nr:hypothetical protein [Carp edema virus]
MTMLSEVEFNSSFDWSKFLEVNKDVLSLSTMYSSKNGEATVTLMIFSAHSTEEFYCITQTLLVYDAIKSDGKAKLKFSHELSETGRVYFWRSTLYHTQVLDERFLDAQMQTKTRGYTLANQMDSTKMEFYTTRNFDPMTQMDTKITENYKVALLPLLNKPEITLIRTSALEDTILETLISNTSDGISEDQKTMTNLNGGVKIVQAYSVLVITKADVLKKVIHDYNSKEIRSNVIMPQFPNIPPPPPLPPKQVVKQISRQESFGGLEGSFLG